MPAGSNGSADARSVEWDALCRGLPLAQGTGRRTARRTTAEIKARGELERKFAWSLGSTFLEEYRRDNGLSRVARRFALYVIDEIGPP